MTKKLELTDQEARTLYKSCNKEWKEILESNFGKDFFSQKVTDRIKTYEDACSELGETPINESKMLEAGFTFDEIAYRKIKTITKALNEDWKANWHDGNQKKWLPWFRPVSPSGFAFCDSFYVFTDASAGSGSRLCFKSSELAEYSGRQFSDLYNALVM